MKKHRELILLGSVVGLVLICSLLFLKGEATVPASDPPQVSPPPSHVGREPESGVVPVVTEVSAADTPEDRKAGAAPDSGIIAGSISMTSEVALNVASFTIEVTEAVNADARTPGSQPPFKVNHTFSVLQAEGTPSFKLSEIPFSEYGYNVTAHVLDHNGDEQFVQLTREKPVARVHLGLRGGVGYSVLVRDQERNPLPGLEVQMVPKGPPRGRKSFHGVTDTYGGALFEKVLRGDYSLSVGPPTAPLVEPRLVTVAQTGIQAEHVEVPRGVPLAFFVTAPGGLGLSNVAVVVTAVDIPQFKRYPLVTDATGNAIFKHLPPGSYNVDFSAHGFTRRTVKVELKAGETQPPRTIELDHAR